MKKPPLHIFYKASKALFLPSILRQFNHQDAEDIFHDMIKSIIEKWDTINDPEHYAAKIIKNLKIKETEKARKFPHQSIDTIAPIELKLNIPENIHPDLNSQLLNNILNSLDPTETTLLQDFYISGLKYDPKLNDYVGMTRKEYSDLHNIPIRTLDRALNKLRTKIQQKLQPTLDGSKQRPETKTVS